LFLHFLFYFFVVVLNQVVICQNTATSEGTIQGVLTHELIHMFDSCTRKLDFRNIEHLACTEIRAANLTHCGLVSSILEGHSSIFNFRKKHQVRKKSLHYNII